MATRREAREWAVQILFQLDLNPPPPNGPLADSVFENFWEGGYRYDEDAAPQNEKTQSVPHLRMFTEQLVRGTWAKRLQIDEAITAQVKNWKMERIGGVERNILRLGVYELSHAPDPPPKRVVINEAIDIAKYFGAAGSGKFVNGVLDAIARRRAAELETGGVWEPGNKNRRLE